MQVFELTDFKGGWFIGDFVPTLFPKTDFEVAIKYYKAGESEKLHYHKIATEVTVIVDGMASMNGKLYRKGNVIVIEKEEATDFVPLVDTITCVIKMPSVKGDKYEKS
jgi:anti-sigma factor ChrR (cupin superfamily)